MNKLLIGILIGLALIVGLLLNLTRIAQGPPRLGTRVSASIARVASTTLDGLGTYFGDQGGTVAGGRRTATTTLLTMRGAYLYDSISVDAVSVSTTTSSGGTVYFQIDTSMDGSIWLPLPIGIVTNTGTFTKDITLNAGNSSSTIAWSPNVTGVGTSSIILPPLKDIPGDFFRVNVGTTGTSTITVGARLLSQ